MNRLTETKLEREMRFSFAYIDHVINQACAKLDELKKEFTKDTSAKIKIDRFPTAFGWKAEHGNPQENVAIGSAAYYRHQSSLQGMANPGLGGNLFSGLQQGYFNELFRL